MEPITTEQTLQTAAVKAKVALSGRAEACFFEFDRQKFHKLIPTESNHAFVQKSEKKNVQ